MQKEIEAIQQLEARRESLSKGIGRISEIYLSDLWRIGKVEADSSFDNAVEVGRTKAAARIAIAGLNNKLEQVNNELRVNDEGRAYLHRVNQMEQGLSEMSELVAEGNLPEDILRKHQQEFAELQKLPETNPLLQRAIERIRQEEEKKKEEETIKPVFEAPLSPKVEGGEEKVETKEELEPGMFRLPDGKLVKLTKMEQRYLPLVPANKDEAIPSSVLATAVYRKEIEKGEIDLNIARNRQRAWCALLNKLKLNPAGWEIKNVTANQFAARGGKAEARLYLARLQEEKQPEDLGEIPPKPLPITEIGEAPTIQPQEQTGGGKYRGFASRTGKTG